MNHNEPHATSQIQQQALMSFQQAVSQTISSTHSQFMSSVSLCALIPSGIDPRNATELLFTILDNQAVEASEQIKANILEQVPPEEKIEISLMLNKLIEQFKEGNEDKDKIITYLECLIALRGVPYSAPDEGEASKEETKEESSIILT